MEKIPKPEDTAGASRDDPVVRQVHRLYADGMTELDAVRERQRSQRTESRRIQRSDRARLLAEDAPVVRRLRELYARGMEELAKRDLQRRR